VCVCVCVCGCVYAGMNVQSTTCFLAQKAKLYSLPEGALGCWCPCAHKCNHTVCVCVCVCVCACVPFFIPHEAVPQSIYAGGQIHEARLSPPLPHNKASAGLLPTEPSGHIRSHSATREPQRGPPARTRMVLFLPKCEDRPIRTKSPFTSKCVRVI